MHHTTKPTKIRRHFDSLIKRFDSDRTRSRDHRARYVPPCGNHSRRSRNLRIVAPCKETNKQTNKYIKEEKKREKRTREKE